MTNPPSQWRTTPPEDRDAIPAIPADTVAAALRVLERWGAMDVAVALGLAEDPVTPAKTPKVHGCRDGACRSCAASNDRRQCPRCGLAMLERSLRRHMMRQHGMWA